MDAAPSMAAYAGQRRFMSEDEIVALLISAVVGGIGWGSYCIAGVRVRRPPGTGHLRIWWILPWICAVVLALLLKVWAAPDVRSDPVYLCFYLVVGAAWVALARWGVGLLGISARDDVFERGNSAAGTALTGALVGHTLCFAGGNFGAGPGWWVVLFSAGLASGSLFGTWAILGTATALADRITIDRDAGAGWRGAGYFVGGGLICGRAAAGDWASAGVTTADFAACAWPLLLLLVAALGAERLVSTAHGRAGEAAVVVAGVLPAAGYVLFGLVVAVLMGPW